MALTDKQRKHLRALAHHRKVIVIVGQNGLSENVIGEVDNALARHELVKVRVNAGDREERQSMIETIAEQTHSEVVQTIGHIGVFYRPADKPAIQLP